MGGLDIARSGERQKPPMNTSSSGSARVDDSKGHPQGGVRGRTNLVKSLKQRFSAAPEGTAALFPLAVPSIAGPGAMMAVIVLSDNDVYTVPERLETGVVLLVVLFLTYVLLVCSDAILRVIGRQGASVLVRVMGLILCSLAVEIVLTALGVGGWTPGAHWRLTS
jgi:small neutral amino acid transporter SnatA (MarC family)